MRILSVFLVQGASAGRLRVPRPRPVHRPERPAIPENLPTNLCFVPSEVADRGDGGG